MKPYLSVVIPSRNGAGRLGETLGALSAQESAEPFEAIVVDDGSDDGTAEAATKSAAGLPLRVVRHPSPRGRSAARNAGVQAAEGDVVLFLDDDMTALPGAIEAHRAFHRTHPGCAARGRVTLAPPAEETSFTRFLRREEAFEARRLEATPNDLPFELCLTGHLSLGRRTFLDAGGLDTSITRYGFEDVELGYRLTRRGVRLCYVPGASTIHRAYMTDLSRYVDRHYEAGRVARQLAERYPEGAFREYLRVDPPAPPDGEAVPAGLAALRAANRLLLRPWFRHAIGSRLGFATVRAFLRAGEAVSADRLVHFGYHVARDVRYFQGYFGEPGPR